MTSISKKNFLMVFLLTGCASKAAYQGQAGFVVLPKQAFSNSAYISCNTTGALGLVQAKAPRLGDNDACFVSHPKLYESENYPPLDGFKLVGMLIQDIEMPAPHANPENNAIGVLTDTFWRNEAKTECILGTHLKMEDVPLADGSYWNINDIARAGFAGLDVSVAYFYKPHSPNLGGNTEVLFRVGRSFTSISANNNSKLLPALDNQLAKNLTFSSTTAANFSENWITFTSDVSFLDKDVSTRQMSSMLYVKYPCDGRDVVQKPEAVRLRSTGQSDQPTLEITMPGLVPVDAQVNVF